MLKIFANIYRYFQLWQQWWWWEEKVRKRLMVAPPRWIIRGRCKLLMANWWLATMPVLAEPAGIIINMNKMNKMVEMVKMVKMVKLVEMVKMVEMIRDQDDHYWHSLGEFKMISVIWMVFYDILRDSSGSALFGLKLFQRVETLFIDHFFFWPTLSLQKLFIDQFCVIINSFWPILSHDKLCLTNNESWF